MNMSHTTNPTLKSDSLNNVTSNVTSISALNSVTRQLSGYTDKDNSLCKGTPSSAVLQLHNNLASFKQLHILKIKHTNAIR